jgi:xanthine dehydrogenase accessory factor
VNDALTAARRIAAAHTEGKELVTITITSGPSAGQRYLSAAPGELEGTASDALDQQARALADEVWRSRQSAFADPLFAELHALSEPLIIFGAGHIAVPLAAIAHGLGFRVTVLDDREDFAHPARFPVDIDVKTLHFSDPLRDIVIDARSYVILLTRAHKYDFDCLRTLLAQSVQPRYIGMIGSKRRVRAAFKALLEAGVPRASLSSVHAPVGIEIGAETPAEIAVSIAAQLIQVRRGFDTTTKASEARVLERMLPEAAAQ